MLAIAALVLAGCTAEPKWDIPADGSCDPAQLQVTVVPRIDHDPARVAVDILLKNISETSCQITGTATVTITDAIHTQPIGEPAAPLPGEAAATAPGNPARALPEAPARVTIPPRSVGYIYLQTIKSLANTPTCIGVLANGIHIVLPGHTNTQAIITSAPVAKYCDEPSRGTFLVSPVTAAPLVIPGVENFVPAVE